MKWIATHFQVVSSKPAMPYGSVHSIISNSRSMHVNKNCSLFERVSFSVSSTNSSIVSSTF